MRFGHASYAGLTLVVLLAGCFDGYECQDGAADVFGVRYLNATNESYYIYLNAGHGGFVEDGFPPSDPHGRGGGIIDCEALGETPYLRIQIREPKPNQEDIHAPEIRGGDLVFDGNWTGLSCNEQYEFIYHGPSDGEVYEADCHGARIRDLTRVPA